jgi:hypothetical protein
MSHLHPERLAALADGEPTSAEAAHLSSCSSCAHEIAVHRRLLMLAWQERETLTAPLASWESLAAAAREEGLIRTASGREGTRTRTAQWAPARAAFPWAQAAAAVLLLTGGMAIGRLALPALGGGDVAPANASFASNEDTTVTFRSTTEAISVLQRAERDYRMAMMYLSGQDTVTRTADDPEIYRARLAALAEINGVALDAVQEAPQDPVMNRLYLSTLGARDATLRQLGEKLPENVHLVGW